MKNNYTIIILIALAVILSWTILIPKNKLSTNIEQFIPLSNKLENEFSQEKQDLIKLQMLYGPEYVQEIDCENFLDNETISYCKAQQDKLSAKAQEITWEQVWEKWEEYIQNFDCSQIKNKYGQKYCQEEQERLNRE